MQISALSLEYVRVQVTATEDGVDVNPTNDVVQMALVVEGTTPGALDWKTASWETDPTTTPNRYFARALVGPSPGVVTLTAGLSYDSWVKFSDNPEVPVIKTGPVRAI